MVTILAEDKNTGFGSFANVEREKLLKDGVTITLKAPHMLKLIVKNEEGQPVVGAGISLTRWFNRSGGFAGEGKTDSNGELAFRDIYEGSSYSWYIKTDGYYNYQSSYPQPNVGSADWKDTEDVILQRSENAHGNVIDEKGNPVSDVEIELIAQDASYNTKTSADGLFEIPVPEANLLGYEDSPSGLVPAGVWLKATYNGGKMGAFAKIERGELLKDGVTLTVKAPQPLTIHIADPNGRPLKNVEVNAGADFGDFGEGGRILYTDDKGKVVVQEIYSGATYGVMTQLRGYYRGSRGSDTATVGSADWKNTIDLVMEPANRTQTGRVVDEEGKPVAGALVRAWVSEEIKTTTNSDGRFSLAGFPASSIYVTAKKDDLVGSVEVTKDTGEVTITVKKNQ